MGKSKIILLYIFCIIFSSCEKEKITQNYYYKIIGETITLTNQEWNQLWKVDIDNLMLYRISPDGIKIVYLKGKDYIVQGNRIKRTFNSQIPNFVNHTVIYDDDGKFKWVPEPNRNPELTLPYQIYADYTYTDTFEYVQPSTKISSILKNKITQRQPLKIATIGTSISFGAHTFEGYFHNSDRQTYHQLVSKALYTYYGLDCKSINYSSDGGGVNQIQDLTKVVREKPDVGFIRVRYE